MWQRESNNVHNTIFMVEYLILAIIKFSLETVLLIFRPESFITWELYCLRDIKLFYTSFFVFPGNVSIIRKFRWC